MSECNRCDGDGLVELSEEEQGRIRPYLDAQPPPRGARYEDGEEISTMQPCPECDR